MRLRAFDVNEPTPKLIEPHALVIIRPWVDVSNAGSLTLSCLENMLGGKELAQLARPGSFFDFTRYRPILKRDGNESEIDIPNTVVTYGRQADGHDF